MKIVEKPKISGEEWFYILDDKEDGGCGEKFLLAPNEFNSNGKIKCEFCPNICRKEDIKGMCFTFLKYTGGTGGANWKCGACGCEFIFKGGQVEESVECPNCHYRKPDTDRVVKNIRETWNPNAETQTLEEQK